MGKIFEDFLITSPNQNFLPNFYLSYEAIFLALDESDKSIKLYYTLPGIQNLPADRVVSKITDE